MKLNTLHIEAAIERIIDFDDASYFRMWEIQVQEHYLTQEVEQINIDNRENFRTIFTKNWPEAFLFGALTQRLQHRTVLL